MDGKLAGSRRFATSMLGKLGGGVCGGGMVLLNRVRVETQLDPTGNTGYRCEKYHVFSGFLYTNQHKGSVAVVYGGQMFLAYSQ